MLRLVPIFVWLCAAVCTAVPLAAQSVHVDPVRGVDLPGGGSVTAPYRSLSYAMGQVLGPLPRFVLHPGRYSAASGEQFPIALPDFCQLEAHSLTTGPAVEFDGSGLTGELLSYAPAGPGALRIAGIAGRGAGFLLRLDLPVQSSYALVELSRCKTEGAGGVSVQAARGSGLDLVLSDAEFDAGAAAPDAMRIVASADANLRLQADRCELRGGTVATLDLDCQAGGLLHATLRSGRILAGAQYGIRARTGSVIADQRITLEHCLLYGHGVRGVGAALLAEAVIAQHVPQFRVLNCIFENNVADVVPGLGQFDYGTNLVSQGDLAGLGGNFVAAADLIDPAAGLYGLRPGSAARERAAAHHTTLLVDIDGEPRGTAQAGSAPDLGPDEYHQHAVTGRRGADLGQQLDLVVTTGATLPFGLLVGTTRTPGAFGAGTLHLGGGWFGTAYAGTTDAQGLGRVQLAVPVEASLRGVELHWQAMVGTAPWFGANAWTTRIGW